ncbi:chemotaxis protein [Nitratireductor pacificus]|uniref:Chemotaxis protein n=1 Tax=Nitratireductor pacificus pht-3B TaxID=391937 RepID=K2M4Y5_9HYPH|nr:chemotaxis protein [Nitratireductor pacificus]EKF17141.1 chemotaxis protein [Nitratireductor pacificus pht-3B]
MRWRVTVAAFLMSGAVLCGGAAAASLQPFQMVRSLQVLQDRIANGDHAALPMQQKLLGIIDDRLRQAAPEDFADQRNLRALLIYGLSGGNPRTLETIFPRLRLEGEQAKLGSAIVHYARGDFQNARDGLRDIDPMTLDPEVGPPVALVTAAVLAAEEPAIAARLLDDARLLSPGTLIEEAALRRSIPVAAALKDTQRFASAAEQYARRFLRSPYASQFADSFVAAIVAMHETVDLAVVDDVAALMSDEQARIVYLRLARKSAIEGYDRLQAFASEKATGYAEQTSTGEDPRATLYANMASVTSDNVEQVLATLGGIDRARLSEKDRELLDAAKAIAHAVLNRPPGSAGTDPAPRNVAEETREEAAPAAVEAAVESEPDAEEAYLRDMRDKLQAIDALLVKETEE